MIDSSPHEPAVTKALRDVLDVLRGEPKNTALDAIVSCKKGRQNARR
jgi:hypothetical protein